LGGIFGENGGVRASGGEGEKNGGVGELLVKECLKVWGKGASFAYSLFENLWLMDYFPLITVF
jgi:hypothetical protein